MTEPREDQAKIERQIELERSWIDKGIEDYYEARERQSEAHLPPGIKLMMDNIDTVIKAVKELYLVPQGRRDSEKFRKIREFLYHIKPEHVALITLSTCINAFTLGKMKKRKRVALQYAIGEQLVTKRNYDELIKYTGKKTEKELSKLKDYHIKKWKIEKLLKQEDQLPPRDKELEGEVGQYLIEMFAESTNLVNLDLSQRTADDEYPIYYLDPTDELLELLEKQHEYFAWLNTTFPPMIVPPIPWNEEGEGGYYLISSSKTWMVRNRDPEGVQVDEDTVFKADHSPEIYRAINAVQNTAWRINEDVYRVLSAVWKKGGGKERKLPYHFKIPKPLCPRCSQEVKPVRKRKYRNEIRSSPKHRCFTRSPKIQSKWKYLMKLWHKEKADNETKLPVMVEKLNITEKYLGEEIYFPYTFDFRGRLFPLSKFLEPQGDDTSRALLEFAKGKPVKGKAIKWLRVHGANCFGKDKLSIADRVAWVESKEHKIRKVAKDPLNYDWWLKADRKKVWRFLAFCFDYAAWLKDPENHESHLPVSVDGKANGLQHYSAMLRDEEGGRAVGLTKSTEEDTPIDIYIEVAKKVNEMVEADATKRDKTGRIAKLWLDEHGKGKVTRSITKKPVMTYPYGVEPWEVRRQIEEAVKDIEKEHEEKTGDKIDFIQIPDRSRLTRNEAINYMRDKVIEATGKTVSSAKRAMNWLEAVADAPNVHNYYGWKSPIGFHVDHMYREQTGELLQVAPIGGITVETSEEEAGLDYRKMRQAMAPNFVHSLDASHLMMTVLKCKEAGIKNFAMVHDSYGTLAADMPRMLELLKEAFVELHKIDRLQWYRDQIIGGIIDSKKVGEANPEEYGRELFGEPLEEGYVAPPEKISNDPIPLYETVDGEEYLEEIESKLEQLKRGNLKLEEVKESAYFFA